MPHTYTELYYHFAWATKGRDPLIDAGAEPHLFRYLRHKCDELKISVHALDGSVDHLHLACRLPPTLSVADCMEKLKGSSSHFMNHRDGAAAPFAWQPGYCALTFSKRELRRVVAYISNQKQHHSAGTLWPKAEQWEEEL